MAGILFVTWDGGGNVPPAIGIAAELQRRGHTVRFLGQEQQRATIEGAGLRFEAYSRPPAWSAAAPKRGTPGWILAVLSVQGPGPGKDLIAAVEREPADLVVIDFVLAGALRAAEQAGVRRAVLVHSFVGVARLKRRSGGPISRLRGKQPTGPWGGAELGLVTTLRDLDPDGRSDLAPTIRYTGPVWQGRPRPATPPAGVPRVLVSLSTVWFPGQVKVLQNVLDALCGAAVQAVVTTGPAVDPAELRAPGGVELHRYLPHAEVLPTVSAVIGHGGHATTMAALAHDLPIIVLPMHRIMDQRGIGLAVQDAGAGRVLDRMSPPDRILQVLHGLLADGPHRAAAAQLGAAIRRCDGATVAADRLTELLAPSHRTGC